MQRRRLLALAALLVLASLPAADARAQTPSAPAPPDPKLPSLIVVGDSTARNNANGAQGWGDPFAAFFDPARVNVLNRARAGRSSRTFVTEGLWERAIADAKPGDVVLIQFGHNDGGPVEGGKGRASLPGVGDEEQEITRPDGARETVLTYGAYLRKMIADARAKGATPVLLSLTVRNLWKDGRVERGSGRFGEWAREVARAEKAPFVDLTALVADRYQALGPEKVRAFFGPDYAHTSPAGAELNAESVVAGLKALPALPLAPLLSDKGRAVAPAPGTAPTP